MIKVISLIVLGFCFVNTGYAGIISRGFLDATLDLYATNIALDLKANQSDLDLLSEKIGAVPPGLNLTRSLMSVINHDYSVLTYPSDLGGRLSETRMILEAALDKIIMYGGYMTYDSTGAVDYMGVRDLTKSIRWPTYFELAGQPWVVELFGLYDTTIDYLDGTTVTDVLFNMFSPTSSDYALHRPGFWQMAERIFIGGNILTDLGKEKSYGLTSFMGLFDLTHYYEKLYNVVNAMDERIDAKELPSDISDGQYVWTAKKVGGEIKYGWVKMDLADFE